MSDPDDTSNSGKTRGVQTVAGQDATDSDISGRLTALELTLQQIKIAVEQLAGNVGSVPSTLTTVLAAINTLNQTVSHLTNVSNMHAAAVSNLTTSAGNILNQATSFYADSQALRGSLMPAWPAQNNFMGPADASFAEMSAVRPGETGQI
jgi:methyl-accepting chemotaxis protein